MNIHFFSMRALKNKYVEHKYGNSLNCFKKNGKNLITITRVECFSHLNIICETIHQKKKNML